MKKTTRTKPPTRKAFARALGISRQVLEHHLKQPGSPAVGDLAGWQAHLVIHGKDGSLPATHRTAMADKKLAIAEEVHRKLKRENDIKSGELISLEEVRRHATHAAEFYDNCLDRIQREGPRLLNGLSIEQIRDWLDRELFEVRESSRVHFDAVEGKPYVRKPYEATRQRYIGPGWKRGPSCQQTMQLDEIVKRTGCQYPNSEAEMDLMLAADDAEKAKAGGAS